MEIPQQLQKYLFEDWNKRWDQCEKSNSEYVDLILIIILCYRTGFGGEKDLSKAKKLEIEAAKLGSDIGQITSLTYGLLDGFEHSITAHEKVTWLKNSLSTIFFPKRPAIDEMQEMEEQTRKIRFCAALNAISDESSEISFLHSFISSWMTWWEILNGAFDSAEQDPLFSCAIEGGVSGLIAAIDSDLEWRSRRKDGFTLLHVAADYCQEHIIRSGY